jgi:hypothetical protein
MGTPQRPRDVVESRSAISSTIHNQVKKGLLKKDANEFFNRQVPRNKLVPGLFNYRQLRQAVIPASTWKSAHDRLSPKLSEKVARIVRVMEMAIDALGDEDWALGMDATTASGAGLSHPCDVAEDGIRCAGRGGYPLQNPLRATGLMSPY